MTSAKGEATFRRVQESALMLFTKASSLMPQRSLSFLGFQSFQGTAVGHLPNGCHELRVHDDEVDKPRQVRKEIPQPDLTTAGARLGPDASMKAAMAGGSSDLLKAAEAAESFQMVSKVH